MFFSYLFGCISGLKNEQNDYRIFGEPYLNYVQGKFISTFLLFANSKIDSTVCPPDAIELFFRWIIVRGQMYSNIKYGVIMAIKDSMRYLIPQFLFFTRKVSFLTFKFFIGANSICLFSYNNQVLEQWNIDNLWAHDLIFNDFFFT